MHYVHEAHAQGKRILIEGANATMLAPFAYLQLVWSMLLGLFLFQTVPDRWILIGAGMIVLSGLYTAHRERVRGAVR